MRGKGTGKMVETQHPFQPERHPTVSEVDPSGIGLSKNPNYDLRPSFEDTFFNIAKLNVLRSTCPRLQVGCVIVRNNQVLTSGYNGAPRGLPHCTAYDPPCNPINDDCSVSCHAEMNAVAMAALHGICIVDSSMFVTHAPCTICARLIIQSGVRKVWYLDAVGSPEKQIATRKMFNLAHVQYLQRPHPLMPRPELAI